MRKIIDSWKKDGKLRGITILLRNYNSEFIIEYYYNITYNEITRTRYLTKIHDRISIPIKEVV